MSDTAVAAFKPFSRAADGAARRRRHPRGLVRQSRHRHSDRWSPTTCRSTAR